ncbi:hypothetical protein D3C73_15520 [compost metagenome]
MIYLLVVFDAQEYAKRVTGGMHTMGLLDSLKSLLGLGETVDGDKDGKFDIEDLKSAATDFADTNNDNKIDASDIEGIPTALSELKDTIASTSDASKKKEQ